MPSWSRIFLKKAALRDSFPGGLVVSMRRYSCSHSTAWSAYCFMRSAGMLWEAKDVADCCACRATAKIASNRKYTAKQLVLWVFAMLSPEMLGSTAYEVFISGLPKITLGVDFSLVPYSDRDYNVIGKQRLSLPPVWH